MEAVKLTHREWALILLMITLMPSYFPDDEESKVIVEELLQIYGKIMNSGYPHVMN